ncbi:MAG TPA: Npt1/Npt2 family nucleotide transporter [Verrucomicrobiota bacterium]|nr:Npt1/Npt2 family nucleotide transporter [Verrucomicrobiota bacterium]
MSFFKVERQILILCGIYFLLALCSLMARATADSFFLKNFDKGSIPLMIMAAAVMSSVVAVFITYLCGRFQVYGAMKLALGALAAAMAGVVAAVFFAAGKVIAVITYMVCDMVVVTPMVLFWGLAVGVLNPKESKRWFGLIGAAGTVGCIVAGYVVSMASRSAQVDVISLGLVTGLMLVALAGLARTSLFGQADAKPGGSPAKAMGGFRSFAGMLRSRQAVLMLMLVVLSTMVLCLIDIHFKFQVARDHTENLNQFFGRFYTYSSIAQLVLQLFIVRTILTKGGVITAITVLPVLLVISSVSALALGTEKGVYAGKFICQVVFFTIEYVGLQMLFLAVKKQSRGQMKSVIDGLTRPATIAVSSLVITATLAFWQQDSVVRLTTVVIVIGCVWVVVAWLNYRQYLASLVGMLDSHVIDFDDETSMMMDSRFDSQLRESLSKASDVEAGFLADLIIGMRRPDWLEEFRAMLVREDETLKLAGMRYLAEFGDAVDRERIIEAVKNATPRLRTEAINCLGANCEGQEFRILEPFLGDPDPGVSCASAAVLLNSGELSINVHAGNLFYEFLHSDESANRRLAVQCLSRIRNLDTGLITGELLDDPDDSIKREAIHSIDADKLESTFERLTGLITEESLRPAISASLQAIGRPAAKMIRCHLDTIEYGDAPETFRLLTQLLIAINESGKSARIEQFIEQVGSETARVQLMIDYCATLGNARSDKELTAFAREQLVEYARQAGFYREQSAKLPEGGQADALRLAFGYHFELRLEVLFKVLRLFDISIDYEKLFRAAASGGENARAEVSEVLEGLLGQADADRIIGLAKPEQAGESACLGHFVETFRESDSRWVLAGLLWMVADDGYAAHGDFVRDSLGHDEEVVRETALEIFLANEPDGEPVVKQCELSAGDACEAVVRLAKRKLSTL